MALSSIPCTFMRGGTSKALMFLEQDLPEDRSQWDEVFLSAMGSPDPYGRQLNGMGGGISSLSKVCIVSPSLRADADIDYTFAQVQIKARGVDYSGNCGNMSSAVGPFAVDQGLVKVQGPEANIRIYNTNTKKLIHATFPLSNNKPTYDGDLEIAGVPGTGAPVRLDFISPGGATTGQLLPTGSVTDELEIPGLGQITVSMIDAANACVFVRAQDFGILGTELPEQLNNNKDLVEKLDLVRRTASVAMRIATNTEAARKISTVPYISLISPPQDFHNLEGQEIMQSEQDLCIRAFAGGVAHQALPLTVSLCTAVAAHITGSVVQESCREISTKGTPLRLGMPSGILNLGAEVRNENGIWIASRGEFYRTARPLFQGRVFINKLLTF